MRHGVTRLIGVLHELIQQGLHESSPGSIFDFAWNNGRCIDHGRFCGRQECGFRAVRFRQMHHVGDVVVFAQQVVQYGHGRRVIKLVNAGSQIYAKHVRRRGRTTIIVVLLALLRKHKTSRDKKFEKVKVARSTGDYPVPTEADLERVGPYAKINPPLRKQTDQNALWEALADGSIMAVTTDQVAKKTIRPVSAKAA